MSTPIRFVSVLRPELGTKLDRAKAVLREHPEWSNAKIGRLVGCTYQHVTRARNALEATGAIGAVVRRTGKDGYVWAPGEGEAHVRRRFADSHAPEPTSGCWLWDSTYASCGYGQFWMNKRRFLAHRASYILFRGPIPKGMCVCHHCDTPICVNPGHLFLGTRNDNNADRHRKGRSAGPRGVRNSSARLIPAQVRAIASATGSDRDVARRFSISPSHVRRIRNGESWAHLFTDTEES